MANEGVRYIKIAKLDKNGRDQTNTLQSLTQITIPYSSGNITYHVLNISEFSSYFLYYVENPNIDWDDRSEIVYTLTGSSLAYTTPTDVESIIFYMPFTSSNDPLGFYVSSSISNLGGTIPNLRDPIDSYQLRTYNQKSINFRVSGSAQFELVPKTGTADLTSSLKIFKSSLTTDPSTILGATEIGSIVLATSSIAASITASFNYNVSHENFSPGDYIFVGIKGERGSGVARLEDLVWHPSTFHITSSAATGVSQSTIPEPYFSSNFFRAFDCQPLLNNAIEARKNTFYQDIDYSSGLLSPTNFELLISGSALKASIPDSNYSSFRSIKPRYLGCKNTSEKINQWTDSNLNEGTYGKTPSVDSKETYIAYCDWVGGYPPEMMSAYAAHVLYLIRSDGTVLNPNVSLFSLPDVKNTFRDGKSLSLNTAGGADPSGQLGGPKPIIKAGARIEPIMYNQISHYLTSNPVMSFASSFDLTDNGKPNGIVQDYRARMISNSNFTTAAPGVWEHYTNYDNLISSGSGLTSLDVAEGQNTYKINPSVITDVSGSITIKATAKAFNSGALPTTAYMRLMNTTQGTELSLQAANGNGYLGDLQGIWTINGVTQPFSYAFNIEVTLDTDTLVANDVYRIEVVTGANVTFLSNNTTFEIFQSPAPTSTITATGLLQKSPWSTKPRSLYITDATFINNYNNPNIKQDEINGSGFNPINQPLNFLPGDEFRFEGDESKVYMVEDTYFSGSNMLVVNLDKTVSGSSFNADQFLLRRYIDDASYIIFNESELNLTNGPFIIKPEFLDGDFDLNLDKILEDLSGKGYFD